MTHPTTRLRRGPRWRRLLAATGVLLVLATGCAPGGEGGLPDLAPPKVDVDTPELRRIKADAGIADCTPGTGEPVDDGLPEVTLRCLGGGPDVDVASLRGPLVVNLWAQWCAPCARELPIYQAFSEKYAGRVAVLGIDFKDMQVERALLLAKDSGVTYPLLADPTYQLEGKGPFRGLLGLPVVVLVDSDGKVAFRQGLEIKSLEELEGLVEEHLGVAS
jgi:thiol-disulfide isomerase/thioredoxin